MTGTLLLISNIISIVSLLILFFITLRFRSKANKAASKLCAKEETHAKDIHAIQNHARIYYKKLERLEAQNKILQYEVDTLQKENEKSIQKNIDKLKESRKQLKEEISKLKNIVDYLKTDDGIKDMNKMKKEMSSLRDRVSWAEHDASCARTRARSAMNNHDIWDHFGF